MSSDERAYDLISMGRACLDLYANEVECYLALQYCKLFVSRSSHMSPPGLA
jgi:hypothetical protein